MKLLFVVLLTLSGFYAPGQSGVTLEERYSDSLPRKLDSILIIGDGSMETQIFLDDLSQILIKGLNELHVTANYHFLEEKDRSGNDHINKAGYKAILFLSPRGASSLDMKGSPNRVYIPTSSGSVPIMFPTPGAFYQQTFTLRLCIPGQDMNSVWDAVAFVKCNLKRTAEAKKLGKKIIAALKSNKYI